MPEGNTIEELLQRYAKWLRIRKGNSECTVSNSVNKTSLFLRWLKEQKIRIEEINQKAIDEYLYYCKTKYSTNSLLPITINLKKLMEFLGKNIDIKYPRLQAPDKDRTALTTYEVKAMFEAAKDNPLESAILKTLYYTGIRASELINLDMADVDFERLRIIVRHGKGNKCRIVNITRDCAIAIKKWERVRTNPNKGHENALFISLKKQRVSNFYLNTLVKRIAAEAGVTKQVYPHKFRITMITHMAEAGLSPREIQVQSGHADIVTVCGYIQHNSSRIRKAYEKVFENSEMVGEVPDEKTDNQPRLNNPHYKKIAMQKYLDGEIDADTLQSIISTLEIKKSEKKKIDPSYL